MLRSLFGSGSGSVEDLIARRKYAKACELLTQQLRARPQDLRLRSQLADVQLLDGRGAEAIRTLGPMADLYVREGEFVKAIAVLKKMQKIDPGRADIEKKLAQTMRRRGGTADAPLSAAPAASADGAGSFVSEIYGELGAAELGLASVSDEPSPAAGGADRGDAAAPALSSDPGSPGGEVAAPFVSESGRQSLFGDFTEAELCEVIAGLTLRSFAPGDIVVTQGEPGDSLFVLTSGRVKAFVKNTASHNVLLREMEEGSFFGEVSVLSGRPRTATITAAAPSELLELDRRALDSIAERHPNVRRVLQSFYERRSGSAEETPAKSSA